MDYLYVCEATNSSLTPIIATSFFHDKNLGDECYRNLNVDSVYLGEITRVLGKAERIKELNGLVLVGFLIPMMNFKPHPYNSMDFPTGTTNKTHLEN